MAKKQISKISDKLVKIGDSFTVNMYDNGFMVELSGQDSNDDWKSAKIMCNTTDDLIKIITEATDMARE